MDGKIVFDRVTFHESVSIHLNQYGLTEHM